MSLDACYLHHQDTIMLEHQSEILAEPRSVVARTRRNCDNPIEQLHGQTAIPRLEVECRIFSLNNEHGYLVIQNGIATTSTTGVLHRDAVPSDVAGLPCANDGSGSIPPPARAGRVWCATWCSTTRCSCRVDMRSLDPSRFVSLSSSFCAPHISLVSVYSPLSLLLSTATSVGLVVLLAAFAARDSACLFIVRRGQDWPRETRNNHGTEKTSAGVVLFQYLTDTMGWPPYDLLSTPETGMPFSSAFGEPHMLL